MMNPIEEIRDYIRVAHPQASLELIPPLHEDGVWSLDVNLAGKQLALEWSPTMGFGVSTRNYDSFGEGPDEILTSIGEARQRVSQLLTSAEVTAPAFGVLLARLRESRGLTQEQLASKLGIRQATISGMEHRDDIQLSTLRRVLEALGGVLEVFGVFPEARYRIDTSSVEHTQREPSIDTTTVSHTAKTAAQRRAAFVCLRQSASLPSAMNKARAIKNRRAILVVPC